MKKILIVLLLCLPMYLIGQASSVLLDFEATSYDWGIHITWKAEAEVNFKHYEVQHRGNFYEWKTIATVEPKQNMEYSVSHLGGVFDGDNYYRLIITNENGYSEQSDICHAEFIKEGGDIRVFPNPGSNRLKVYSPRERSAYIQFYDFNGRLVLQGPTNCQRFDVTELPIGSYIIVITAGPLKENKLFIKQ
jgi:hypothetical protein